MKLYVSQYVLEMVEAFASEIPNNPKTREEIEDVKRKTVLLSNIVASQLVQEAMERKRYMEQPVWFTRTVGRDLARHNITVQEGVVTWESYEGLEGVSVVRDMAPLVGTPFLQVSMWPSTRVHH